MQNNLNFNHYQENMNNRLKIEITIIIHSYEIIQLHKLAIKQTLVINY